MLTYKEVKKFVILAFCPVLVCGCASLISKMVVRHNNYVPQIVAHLEPALRENKIFIAGKIAVQNLTESDLALENVLLTIQDETGKVLVRPIINWEGGFIRAGGELVSGIEIELDLAVLDKEELNIFLKTGFIYKKLNLRIPIENKVAVLHLGALRRSIIRPLGVSISTKFYPDIYGDVSIEYALGITNPAAVDLMLEETVIRICPGEKNAAVESAVKPALFSAEKISRLNGFIKLEKKTSAAIIRQFIQGKPVRVEVSGKLRLPGTEVFMPFNIESVQELDFSLFSK